MFQLHSRNLVSYSDGPRGNSTGRLLFYLTQLDATATDVQVGLPLHCFTGRHYAS